MATYAASSLIIVFYILWAKAQGMRPPGRIREESPANFHANRCTRPIYVVGIISISFFATRSDMSQVSVRICGARPLEVEKETSLGP
ncbi:hypothetical protein BDR22DRAFT_318419 [Usnea florida]